MTTESPKALLRQYLAEMDRRKGIPVDLLAPNFTAIMKETRLGMALPTRSPPVSLTQPSLM